jgi:hypothetical protein
MKNNLNDRLDMLVKLERLIVDEVSLCNVGDFEGCDEDEYYWEKRKIGYYINNNVVLKIFKRMYNEVEELLWLGLCVGILVIVVNFILLLGF